MRVLLVLLFSCFFSHGALGLIIGSESIPSREALYDFLSQDSDNEMSGFAYFENGFLLEGLASFCVFNSVFPVSGTFFLNNGTLDLSRNFSLSSKAIFGNSGTINGNGYVLNMPRARSVELTKNLIITPGEQGLMLVDSVDTAAQIYSVDWSYDNNYIAVGLNSSASQELKIYHFNGAVLTLKDSIAINKTVSSVRWHPANYLLAVASDTGSGNEISIYELSSGSETLSLKSGVGLGSYHARAVAWNPEGTHIAVNAENAGSETSRVYIYAISGNGTLSQTTYSNLASNVDFRRNTVEWDGTGNYFIMGIENNSSWYELRIYYFNGSSVSLKSYYDIAQTVASVSYSPVKDWVAMGLESGSERLRIYERKNNALATEKTAARIGESLTVSALHFSSDGTKLLFGREAGSGTELRVYEVDQTTAALELIDGVYSSHTVNTARWSHDDNYVAIGDSGSILSVYSLDGQTFIEQGPITQDPVVFNNLNVRFNSDVLSVNPIKCLGDCIINGKGHIVDLSSTGSLAVDSGASLLLQNITLKGVHGGNLICLDNNATLSFDNVTLLCDGDYSFTQGALEILGDVKIVGSHVFSYKSSNVSTIKENATLFFDTGMTFKYDPVTPVRDLLAMEDETSVLHLYETTLHSTTTGMQLTKGTIVVQGECPVFSDAIVPAQGIVFGDGLSADNNLTLKVLGGSGLIINSGYMTYENI